MKNIAIVGVDVVDKEVVASLLGGDDNVVGTISFWIRDDIRRHEFRRQAEELMNGNVLVDLAISFGTGRWRLLGKNRVVIGGVEPTKLEISQSLPPKREDKGKGSNGEPNWGLGWPEAWGGED